MLLNTDLPYLEPLLFHLRTDEALKGQFTEHSFFMPHHDLVSATEESMAKDCPSPRALWILPGDTRAQALREGCSSPGVHSFVIEIVVQCIRDPFQIVKRDDVARLEGQSMELFMLRKLVKKSVLDFVNNRPKTNPKQFEGLSWVSDKMLYPSGEDKFLATAIEFQVTIY